MQVGYINFLFVGLFVFCFLQTHEFFTNTRSEVDIFGEMAYVDLYFAIVAIEK